MTTTSEHSLNPLSPDAALFLDDAIAAFGTEGATNIWHSIESSIADAECALPLMEAPRVELRVADSDEGEKVDSISGWSYVHEPLVRICFNPAVSIPFVLHNIPELVHHEFAHSAHSQINPALKSDPSYLASVISEGVAVHAGRSARSDYKPSDVHQYFDHPDKELPRKIDDTLIDLLYGSAGGQREKYHEFIRGDAQFPRRGWVVGHWVVAHRVVEENLSVRETMEIPLNDWRGFIEKL